MSLVMDCGKASESGGQVKMDPAVMQFIPVKISRNESFDDIGVVGIEGQPAVDQPAHPFDALCTGTDAGEL